MHIPFEPVLFGVPINVHLVMEVLAFFLAFRYYVFLRQSVQDPISNRNRITIILGAVVGAYMGSRIFAFLEYPYFEFSQAKIIMLLTGKTIMGGLFGGLLGVELAKKIIGEKASSGDLFTLPIMAGIFIGRIGCFLNGINEFTYGTTTTFFAGMDLGDGLDRHPIALYELAFLSILFPILKTAGKSKNLVSGDLFKFFMLAYFGFRFLIEFIKPNEFFVLGLSSIQWLCIICWLYYIKFIIRIVTHAR